MLTYVYTARNSQTGDKIKAEIQAESEQAAAKLLLKQNLTPITIEAKEEANSLFGVFGHRVTTKDRILFTRQLSTLINAGLPLTQSLRTVREQINSPALLTIINEVITTVEGGSTLADALGQHEDVFNNVYLSLVAAGEASGSLDKSLARIANQQEKDAALTSKIRSAMVYPAIVLAVIMAVLIFMLTTVLPQIEQLYLDLNQNLPFLTNLLLKISGAITSFWWLAILLIIGGVVALRAYFKTSAGRHFIDRFKMKVPLFGPIFMKVYMARFCRTSSVLLKSGLPMLEMLRIVSEGINNVYIEKAITKAADKVKGGKALSSTLQDNPYFLVLVPQMIKIGEQSGTIDDMLSKTAEFYEDEVDNAVKNLSTTIEPILMVTLGITVGIIVAAILLPVYGLINLDSLSG